MPDHAGFIARIIADRDDDHPRLVYADWLLDHGQDARAEFIQLQCQLAKAPPRYCDCDSFHLENCAGEKWDQHWGGRQERERELFSLYFHEWATVTIRVNPTDDIVFNYGLSLADWSRGFISRINCSAANWITYADTFTKLMPLETVTLKTWPAITCHTGKTGSGRGAMSSFVLAGRPPANPNDPGRSGIFSRLQAPSLLKAAWPAITFELPPIFEDVPGVAV